MRHQAEEERQVAARDPQRQVSAVLTLVATASAGIGAAYLGLIPLIASRTELSWVPQDRSRNCKLKCGTRTREI